MDIGGLTGLTVENGLSVGVFILCAWLTVTIVTRLCGAMDRLDRRMEGFMKNVEREHKASQEQHNSMMQQHTEMITTLGRINGYKQGGQ